MTVQAYLWPSLRRPGWEPGYPEAKHRQDTLDYRGAEDPMDHFRLTTASFKIPALS